MMQKVVLTGDRPSGKLHLGHYVGSLLNRIQLQAEETYQSYVMIADTQALTDNFERPEKITESVFDIMRDYLAVGIDPERTTIFIQSQVPELAELTVYYLNFVTLSRLERNPTVKTELAQKGFETSIPVGFLCYPVSQTADITAFKTELVPVGEDQLPLIEQSNEIVRRFNRTYNTDILKEATPLVSKTGRLVGIDGRAKASKSLNNAIFLSDSPEDIRTKVFAMFTDPNHVRVSDPGRVEGNVVFTYLDAFHTDFEEVAALKARYQHGGLGDTAIKEILNATLQTLLEPIRERRQTFTHKELCDILQTSTHAARRVAQQTLEEVRNTIGLRYFD
ncbi:MAG: tryptophan--tRNA ligase [Holosporales bacterium]|jgi:tryptophanyl-tRNA synthetase|nr:tryptophan--tRNA ligase [Holosporales bacterium]